MAEPPLKPVLQKPPGCVDPNIPAEQSGFRPPPRRALLPPSFHQREGKKFDVSFGEGEGEASAGTTAVTGFTMGKQSTTSLKVETNVSNMLVADDVGNRLRTGHRIKTLPVNVEARTKVGLGVAGVEDW
ncbi:3'-5'-exoribonuclease family protein isoform 1 [Hibiscus syriacus]|uniref:3'-5'-exoribonuclease family protein isoform 1 n=1 Tax=Hibiscus syriacus TaxID=106335 RepID=A0A6A3ADS6_HIBSY|nr:3'-5'-exoribonuclease family protein isoform 1 [Hibiscus syriacus]